MRAPKGIKKSSHLLDPLGNIALNPEQHNGLVLRESITNLSRRSPGEPFRTGHEALISSITRFNNITHDPHQPTPRLARTIRGHRTSFAKFERHSWSNLEWGGD